MRVPWCFVASLMLGFAIGAQTAASQALSSKRRPYRAVVDTLNQEAEASDPAGIHQYSQDLIEMLVPDQVGKDYIDSLSGRLAKAEQLAREGKGKPVPEADIARVFNRLMRQIGAPASLRTDEAMVRRFRLGHMSFSPITTLISADRNGNYCNPGEAVFLLETMLTNNGVLDNPSSPNELSETPREDMPRALNSSSITPLATNARWLLSSYASRHRHATIKLFNNTAKTFNF